MFSGERARGPCALVAARPERSRRSAIAIAALWRHPGGAQTDLQIDQRSSLGSANASRRRSETSRRCANASHCRQIESQRRWEGSPNGLIASRVAGTGLGDNRNDARRRRNESRVCRNASPDRRNESRRPNPTRAKRFVAACVSPAFRSFTSQPTPAFALGYGVARGRLYSRKRA